MNLTDPEESSADDMAGEFLGRVCQLLRQNSGARGTADSVRLQRPGEAAVSGAVTFPVPALASGGTEAVVAVTRLQGGLAAWESQAIGIIHEH